MAFPPPPITIRQRGSTCVELLRAPWRVLAVGFHSFLSEWLEKVSQPSLAEPFGSNLGRQWNQQPPVFPLARASPHRLPIPPSVSNAVTFVTGCLYASIYFGSNFCVFYFSKRNRKSLKLKMPLEQVKICNSNLNQSVSNLDLIGDEFSYFNHLCRAFVFRPWPEETF